MPSNPPLWWNGLTGPLPKFRKTWHPSWGDQTAPRSVEPSWFGIRPYNEEIVRGYTGDKLTVDSVIKDVARPAAEIIKASNKSATHVSKDDMTRRLKRGAGWHETEETEEGETTTFEERLKHSDPRTGVIVDWTGDDYREADRAELLRLEEEHEAAMAVYREASREARQTLPDWLASVLAIDSSLIWAEHNGATVFKAVEPDWNGKGKMPAKHRNWLHLTQSDARTRGNLIVWRGAEDVALVLGMKVTAYRNKLARYNTRLAKYGNKVAGVTK